MGRLSAPTPPASKAASVFGQSTLLASGTCANAGRGIRLHSSGNIGVGFLIRGGCQYANLRIANAPRRHTLHELLLAPSARSRILGMSTGVGKLQLADPSTLRVSQ